MSPRTGRPTDCKKDHDLKVRVDSDTHSKLLEYCTKHGVSKAEAIRQAIANLLASEN